MRQLDINYNRVNIKTNFIYSWQIKLEWGCPNGTKYPPRQPIQTIQVMHQIGKQLCARNHFQ